MKKEAIEVLMNRRAIRCYKAEQVSQEELTAVLEAGTYAPTSRGLQTPYIVAVQEPEDLALVKKLNAQIKGKPDEDPYYGAPTVVIVFAPDDVGGVISASAVMDNMVNAAYAVGLGSCWIHRPREMFQTEEGKALMRKWGLDESLCGVASMALGYADCEQPQPEARKEGYYRIIK